jgi:hypothetical protein
MNDTVSESDDDQRQPLATCDTVWESDDDLSSVQQPIVDSVKNYTNSHSIDDLDKVHRLIYNSIQACLSINIRVPIGPAELFYEQWDANGPHPVYEQRGQNVDARVLRAHGTAMHYTYHELLTDDEKDLLGAEIDALHGAMVRPIYMLLPTWLVYDLLAYDRIAEYPFFSAVRRELIDSRIDELRAVARARAFGWDWSWRHHFHPVARRHAISFLLVANVAAREGNPLGRLPYELLVRIVNYLVCDVAIVI